MTTHLYPDEVLTICKIKQWAQDRAALRAGKTTNYNPSGWTPRMNRNADARIVRVVDFDRAMSRLSEAEQTLLLLAYRDRFTYAEISCLTGISTRSLTRQIPAARKKLGEILDRLDLL